MTDTMDFESIRIFKPQNSTTNENRFRYLVNDNAMATEKTAEGIRKFAADIHKLEKFVASKIGLTNKPVAVSV